MMYRKIILILISSLVLSCNSSKNSKEEQQEEVVFVEDSDLQMNDAMAKAKVTFSIFEEAYASKSDKSNYSVKQKFASEGHIEHIWVGNIQKEGSDYYGVVDNEPVYITSVELGSTVKVDLEQLSDWMILDTETGKVKGGYTIQVLRNKMSDQEKEQFDNNSGLVFE